MAQSINNNNQSTTVVTCDHCDKQCDKLYPSGGMDEICLGCYTKYCRPQGKNEDDEDYLTRLPYHSDMTMKKAHEHYYQILMKDKNPITYEEFEVRLHAYLKRVLEDTTKKECECGNKENLQQVMVGGSHLGNEYETWCKKCIELAEE